MRKEITKISWYAAALVMGLNVGALYGSPAAAQSTAARVLSNAVVSQPVLFDATPALSTLLSPAATAQGTREIHAPMKPKASQLAFNLAPLEVAAAAAGVFRGLGKLGALSIAPV
jgi:hypothetical protein